VTQHDIIAAQIGRPPRSAPAIAKHCHFKLPVVLQIPETLDDRDPFPTRYWLSCPLACKRISRLEAQGTVQSLNARIQEDSAFAQAFFARNAQLERGVGGTSRSVKCLHAHYADFTAGHNNPIGAWVDAQIAPLNCKQACVHDVEGKIQRNPGWQEPPP